LLNFFSKNYFFDEKSHFFGGFRIFLRIEIYLKDNFIVFIMIKVKRITEVLGRKVFTDAGDLFGYVEELNLFDNKIDGWRIVVSRQSGMNSLLGGARGIIVPHQFVKAIGDVIVISKNAVPIRGEEDLPMVDQEDLV
jgi:sporulation protein YlmC with PRC-barrel domain